MGDKEKFKWCVLVKDKCTLIWANRWHAFLSAYTSSPTVNDVTVKNIFALLLMAMFESHVLDVGGVFLLDFFEQDERIFMGMPESFEKYFANDDVPELQKQFMN